MNNLKEIAVDSMEEAFDGCYTCDRVWSAWSYNTMGIGDFGHFDSDNHQFEECFESLIRKLDDADLVSKEAFEKKVMAVVSPFELYYNDNIIDNLNPDGFDSDVFEIVNLDEMFKSFKEYKASLKIKGFLDLTELAHTHRNISCCDKAHIIRNVRRVTHF